MKLKLWVGIALCCAACSSGDGDDDSDRTPPNDSNLVPCVDHDSECGATCSDTEPCSTGLYCTTSDHCAKSCIPGELDGPLACEGSGMCNVNGQCVTIAPIGGGGAPPAFDAGANRDGGPMTRCQDTVVQATRVIPTVILIVDQSASMDEDFGGGSRWDVLRDFLLKDPDGLIAELQSQVSFGLALYSGRSKEVDDGSGNVTVEPDGECPVVTTVAPMLDNFTAIADTYLANEPIDDTPTGDSIDKVVEDLNITFDPDAKAHPVVFVLATDGEPDRCEELDPQTDEGKAEAIAAVEHAFMLGVRTFVISVGNEVGADHQQDIANAGLGRMPGEEDAEYWVAGDDRSLRDALSEIVGSQLSCEVALDGMVKGGDACKGRVTLNGNDLECDSPNGWELSDPDHIRLLGDACEELKVTEDLLLEVQFPCDVSVVL